jgi:predicted dehydrogenase
MVKYRTALVGCGRIGFLLENDPLREKPCTHAGAIIKHNEMDLVAGCDLDSQRLEELGKTFEIKELYSDYKKMISEVKPDIVSVAVWTEMHAEIVCFAAKNGVKGIYCEKPIAGKIEEGYAMVDSCKNNNVKLLVGHERRYHPFYVQAKELIESGEIGKVKTIIGCALCGAPGKLSTDKYYGGPIFHDGTHLIDIIRFLNGDIISVKGVVERDFGEDNIEHTTYGLLTLKNGARAFIEGGGERSYFLFEVDIQGTKGKIVIGNNGFKYFKSGISKRFSGYNELEEIMLPRYDYVNVFSKAFDDLVSSVKNDKQPISDGTDGLKALEVIITLYESAKCNGLEINIDNKKYGVN